MSNLTAWFKREGEREIVTFFLRSINLAALQAEKRVRERRGGGEGGRHTIQAETLTKTKREVVGLYEHNPDKHNSKCLLVLALMDPPEQTSAS